LETAEIVPLAAIALEQEILHPQGNVLQVFTALAAKAQQHQQTIHARQVTSAKREQHNQ